MTRQVPLNSTSDELYLNILTPRQNGRHFPDDVLKWIFLNENVSILLKISLKFVPKVRINNIPALDQATSHYLNHWWLVYWRIFTSLGLNELTLEVPLYFLFYFQTSMKWNANIFIQEPSFERVLWKEATISFGSQCFKYVGKHHNWTIRATR